MSDLFQVVLRLEEVGGRLILDGDRIRYAIPKENREAPGLLAKLRDRRAEVAAFLKVRRSRPTMPPGVRLIRWNLKDPPIAIETCSVVTDPPLFAKGTLEQLRLAIENPKRWAGWSVPQLLDRLGQIGVIVALESQDVLERPEAVSGS
jgi:hypothetical protein